MRTSATLFHSSPVSKTTTITAAAATTPNETFSPAATIHRSPWQSPVPYLFGGLAAMLGLISFALLILACSYWKLSGRVHGGDDGGDAEKGDGGPDTKTSTFFEEKFLVIMAGEVKPTFLATPTSSRASSFTDEKNNSKNRDKKLENEKPKNQNDSDVTTHENGETSQESQFSQQII